MNIDLTNYQVTCLIIEDKRNFYVGKLCFNGDGLIKKTHRQSEKMCL